MGHVNYQVLKNKHEHERRNGGFVQVCLVNGTDTGQVMSSIDIHSAGTTDSFSTTTSERECWVYFILDLDQSIQEHGTAFAHIDVVRHIFWSILGIIRVSSVDIKPLHLFLLLISYTLIKLNCVVYLQQL